MQIIQMADFHIEKNTDLERIKNKIDKLYLSLKNDLNKEEQIILCLLGDIVERGDSDSYPKAQEAIVYLKNKFVEYKDFFIESVPGNHDLCNCPFSPLPTECSKTMCSLDSFNLFCKNIGAHSCFSDSTSFSEYNDANILIANSVYDAKCKYGLIDLNKIKNFGNTKQTIIITHHAFLSENNNDVSAVRNGYGILNSIENKNIIGILHGHNHGYKDIVFGNKCRLIGVGPFLKEVTDVSNQFNLICIDKRGLLKIKNYYYRGDLDEYKSDTVFARKGAGTYLSSSIKDAYHTIVGDTLSSGVISNLVLKLSMPVELFNKQIEELFPAHIEIAKDWQKEIVPGNLYYNHGQYMQYNGNKAIDFVIDELKAKSTSSRAIIPLINFKNVYESGDDFLPSFDIVQFGFNGESKEKIVTTLYLRALEVNHFLKINLCELYVLCNSIREEIRSINEIELNVFAFRAQYKEKFGCFAKATLDITSESKLFSLLHSGKTSEINRLLQEKIDFNETVVRDEGINNLYRALTTLKEELPVRDEILSNMNNVMTRMKTLKEERMKTSNYSEINKIEHYVHEAFEKLIKSLNQGVLHDA